MMLDTDAIVSMAEAEEIFPGDAHRRPIWTGGHLQTR